MLKKGVYLFIYLFSSVVFATAPFVSFSVDSGMFVKPYYNRSVGQATLLFYDFTNMGYWYSIKQLSYFNRKSGFYARSFLTGLIMNHSYFLAFSLPYKEFGHGSRGRAFGVEPRYVVGGSEHLSNTYYDYFGRILGNLETQVTSSTIKPAISDLSVHSSVDTRDFDLIWYAAGVNNQVFLSQMIDDRFYDRQVTSVYDLMGFFTSKMAISYMDDSYLNQIRLQYLEKGIDMSFSDLKRYNGYSVLGSLTFWAFIDGWSRYLVSGIDHIQYNEVYNVRLPDVCMYLTSHGPSYRLQSGYKLSTKTHVPFAIEYVFQGQTQLEYTLGFSKKWSWPVQSYSEIRLGEGLGITQSFNIDLPHFSTLGFGVDYYDFHNLYGERHIPSLKDGNQDLHYWVSFSYR